MSPAEVCDVSSYFFDGTDSVLLGLRELESMDTLLEHELLDTAIHYTQESREVTNDSTYWQLRKDWGAFPVWIIPEDREILNLCNRSQMWSFFYRLSGGQWLVEGWHDCYFRSPLQHVKFESFRSLGFAIWSTARLAGYGFLLPTERYHNPGLLPPYYEA